EDEPQSYDALVSNHDSAPGDSPQEDELQSEIIASAGQFTLLSKFDNYAFRDDLAECCLYDYCSLCYKKKAQFGGFSFDNNHKQYHTHRPCHPYPSREDPLCS